MAKRSVNQVGEPDDQIVLGLLNAVKDNHALTQRSAAKELGVALGLVNAYLKRCIRKGLIKVQQVPSNRYAYFLTPQGFAEKSRLTAEFLNQSLNLFRQAQRDFRAELSLCEKKGWTRIILYGWSDLVEITELCAKDYAVELIGVVETGTYDADGSGLRVVESLDAFGDAFDAVVITDLDQPQAAYERVVQRVPPERVLAPAVLEIYTGAVDESGDMPS